MDKRELIGLLQEEMPEELAAEMEAGNEVKQMWIPKNDQEADWWIEINQEEIKQIERLEHQLQEKIATYQHRLQKVQQEKEFKQRNMTSRLAIYFDTIAADQKKKTKTQEKYTLPSGEIIKKYPAPRIVRDEEKLLGWIKSQKGLEEYIQTTEKVAWGELKKLTEQTGDFLVMKETGEIIDGIELEHREPIIEIKLG